MREALDTVGIEQRLMPQAAEYWIPAAADLMMIALPFLLRPRLARRRNRALWPAHGLAASTSGSALQVQRVVVGLRLPHLPDFLADQTLVGGSDAERLAELLERQAQLVANLWKWQSAAFSLRYIYRPEQRGR